MKLISEYKFNSNRVSERKARLFTLRNKSGLTAQFTNYGARWVSMWVPDRYGKFCDIVLGFGKLSQYLKAEEKYHGAIVGRVAGRISNSVFKINDTHYFLEPNDGFLGLYKNNVHGGSDGLSFRYWNSNICENRIEDSCLRFTYFSSDGEGGYPGNVYFQVDYALTDDNCLLIEYKATTDSPTILNLTNHVFFNLKGEGEGNILDHDLFIDADYFIETDQELIPTSRILSVYNTPLDFTKQQGIFNNINERYQNHLFEGKGYVVSYVLNRKLRSEDVAARIKSPITGITVEISTDQPSMQLYTGWLFSGLDIGKKGCSYIENGGIALEPQKFTDAINQSSFPSIIVSPDKPYRHKTLYRFLQEPF